MLAPKLNLPFSHFFFPSLPFTYTPVLSACSPFFRPYLPSAPSFYRVSPRQLKSRPLSSLLYPISPPATAVRQVHPRSSLAPLSPSIHDQDGPRPYSPIPIYPQCTRNCLHPALHCLRLFSFLCFYLILFFAFVVFPHPRPLVAAHPLSLLSLYIHSSFLSVPFCPTT